MPRIVECGCCGGYHPVEFFGDCRDDENRFENEDEAMERLEVSEVEVERFEYDDGKVIDHWVEMWSGQWIVEVLPIDSDEGQ